MLKKEGNLTFSQIREKLGMTDRAVSYNLSGLLDEKTIEFTKKGREKHYRIGSEASKITKRKVSLFSSEVFETLPDYSEEGFDLNNLFQAVPRQILITWFFVMFKGIKQGENWLEGMDFKEYSRNMMHRLMDLISYPNESDELHDVLMSYDEINFEKIKKIIEKDLKKKKNFEKIEATFKQEYLKEYNLLENIYKSISK